MAYKRCRINSAEGGRAVVDAERDGHPNAHVRWKMPFLWYAHGGADRVTVAKMAGGFRHGAGQRPGRPRRVDQGRPDRAVGPDRG